MRSFLKSALLALVLAASGTQACDRDADCTDFSIGVPAVRTGFLHTCIDGQCKIPNGGYCSFGENGVQPLCASGFCLGLEQGNLGEPVCGTVDIDIMGARRLQGAATLECVDARGTAFCESKR